MVLASRQRTGSNVPSFKSLVEFEGWGRCVILPGLGQCFGFISVHWQSQSYFNSKILFSFIGRNADYFSSRPQRFAVVKQMKVCQVSNISCIILLITW